MRIRKSGLERFRFVFIMLFIIFNGIKSVSAEDKVVVWKSPTCGCCEAWITYLEGEGFDVVSHNIENVVPIKNRLGLKDPALYSCHTAVVSGYVIEGHVPAMDIRRLLNERPDILGLTAPGMPQLSPGMASIIPKNYDVLSFNEAQQVEIYSRYWNKINIYRPRVWAEINSATDRMKILMGPSG